MYQLNLKKYGEKNSLQFIEDQILMDISNVKDNECPVNKVGPDRVATKSSEASKIEEE